MIPQYKQIKETSWKLRPGGSGLYLCNEIVNREVESICIDCKRTNCKGDDGATREEEINIPTT